jgi:hypothetical protein
VDAVTRVESPEDAVARALAACNHA